MKAATALLAVLSAAVSASPVATRQTTTEFDVTSLYASCTPHSSLCYYSLNVTFPPSTTAVECSGTALSYQTLPELKPTACKDPSVSFAYTLTEGGADLVIDWEYQDGFNLTGKHFIPSSEIEWTNPENPNGRVQVYRGPRDFAITDLTATASA